MKSFSRIVGHSLGCHFIKCCIKEIAENKDEDFKINNKIEKIIFLGGATQIKNNKRWQNIFSAVTKGNILNFYSNKDRALGLMETKLVWKKINRKKWFVNFRYLMFIIMTVQILNLKTI